MHRNLKASPQIEADKRLLQYENYEHYLDSLGTNQDECYLQSVEVARQVAELGYRSSGETLSREQFERRLAAVYQYLYPPYTPYHATSEGMVKDDPLKIELALRERSNRVGILSTIIFIKLETKAGYEISGYLDYGDKLIVENWKPIFVGHKKIMPKPTDLGYYNWRSGKVVCNDSSHFKVKHTFRSLLNMIFPF
nr:unnamed protein product [Callosobruchus chinensis]